MKAFLILEDGHVFAGTSLGTKRNVVSEIVFNTSMTGYTEVLTDPSYSGQTTVMTYPLIANYGVCLADMESDQIWPDGFIVRELSRSYSNFRSGESLRSFLLKYDIPCLSGIDTRAVTKLLREKGTMRGMITHDEHYDLDEALARIRAYQTGDEVGRVTCSKPAHYPAEGPERGHGTLSNASETALPRETAEAGVRPYRVALLDYGCKRNIVRSLNRRGCDVTLYPAKTTAEEILAACPDGIMLSNGPGDPKAYPGMIAEVRKLYDSNVPIFAICLGHQLMALAMGAETGRLKYGHRGANHPVRDLRSGRVYMSSQNHGYVVQEETIPQGIAVPLFENVNDGTNEGLDYPGKDIFTVQFHPEASPGPQDTAFLFDRFTAMMEAHRQGAAMGMAKEAAFRGEQDLCGKGACHA